MTRAGADDLFARVRAAVARALAEKSYLRSKDEAWSTLLAAADRRSASGDATSPLDVEVESTFGDRLDLELVLEVAGLDGAAYAAAAGEASSVREVAPLTLRCAIAHAFPKEQAQRRALRRLPSDVVPASPLFAVRRPAMHGLDRAGAFLDALSADLRERPRGRATRSTGGERSRAPGGQGAGGSRAPLP